MWHYSGSYAVCLGPALGPWFRDSAWHSGGWWTRSSILWALPSPSGAIFCALGIVLGSMGTAPRTLATASGAQGALGSASEVFAGQGNQDQRGYAGLHFGVSPQWAATRAAR